MEVNQVFAQILLGMRFYIAGLLCVISLFLPAAGQAQEALDITTEPPAALGKYALFLQEQNNQLTYQQALGQMSQYAAPVDRDILSLGIGADPVWMLFEFDNTHSSSLVRYLSVENSWLDLVEVYFLEQGELVSSVKAGDQQPFHARSEPNRYFVFEHSFAPGPTQVLIRIESEDPLVVPVQIYTPQRFRDSSASVGMQYGILYGYLIALLAYNLLLAMSLKSSRYYFYSIYLFSFLLMNSSYTGQAYQWLWPDLPHWQQCANPVLMLLYVITGILFANRFLETRQHSLWLYNLLYIFMLLLIVLAALFYLLNQHVYLLYLAFLAIGPFVGIMVLSGMVAFRKGMKEAGYFVAATLFASLGAAITALTVAGVVDYHPLGFHAVELGLVVEATLFALALAYQFRLQQEQRIRAEHLAEVDQLTGVYNRRGFERMMTPMFSTAKRNQRNICLLILDLDHFKNINDSFGHGVGDRVLKEIAQLLQREIRKGDLLARWGGEEFLLLLPETSPKDALVFAQRLRERCEDFSVRHGQERIHCTVSIGLSELSSEMQTFDELLHEADSCLYKAKAAGRNSVCYEVPVAHTV